MPTRKMTMPQPAAAIHRSLLVTIAWQLACSGMFESRESGPVVGIVMVDGLGLGSSLGSMNQVDTLVPGRMCPPVLLVTPLTVALPRNCWQSPLLKGWLPAESARYELMNATRISEMKT